MIIRTILTLFLIMVFQHFVNAQFNESIRTGRPGQGVGSYAVGKRVIQMQTGFDIGGDLKGKDYKYSYLSTNIRFGLLEKFEINSAWAYQKEKSSSVSVSGISLSSIGARIHLLNPTKKLPSIGLQLSAITPFRTGDYIAKGIGLKGLLSATKKTSNNSNLLFNLLYNKPTNNTEFWNYVINYAYNISNKWGLFIENYAIFTADRFDNYWDTGFSYLVNNNLQLDASGGTSLNEAVPNFFISIGFSGRIVSLRK